MAAVLDSAPLRGSLRFREPAEVHLGWPFGGPVARYYAPADRSDLLQFLRVLPPTEPLLWLGAGSNLVVRDAGFQGTLLAPRRAFDTLRLCADGRVLVGAGVRLPKLARFCAQHRLGGSEGFARWPNTVGGALRRGVVRDGLSLWGRVESVHTLDRFGRERVMTLHEVRAGGLSDAHWLTAARLGFDRAGSATAPPPAASGPVAFHGPLYRAVAGCSVHELVRQSGVRGAAFGGVSLAGNDGNFVHCAPGARAADLERLVQHVRAQVQDRLGVHLQPLLHLVGRSEA